MSFGIQPRVNDSLWCIFSAPFIHGSLDHLVNNLAGFVVLSWFCLFRSIRVYLWSSFFIISIGGGLVWLFGRSATHIGASGWVFGLWSLSIALAWFDRRLINIFIAVLVVFLYGGMIYGVLPQDARVSFESHFAGAIAGIFAAWITNKRWFRKLR